MRCPVDKKDMIVVEHQKIELDYCLQCSGVWFDASELDLLVEALKREGAQIKQDDLMTTQKADVKEAARNCPHCGTKMNKVWMGKEPRVLIDSCQRGHGLWFDGGELHQILCQLETADKKGGKDILSFLGDTFKADCKK
jgi:Zn-finger nucleic acid-binding protein